jgi:hypothetical protein
LIATSAPIVREHDGIMVIRDDLYLGGTKARYVGALFNFADEVVYASPPEGGAQTALARVASILGKRATIFVAKRARPHPRTMMAKALGAKVMQVTHGRLSVVRARARTYCEATGAYLIPFGLNTPQAAQAISSAALQTGLDPAEVWCAAGSGVLARGIAQAWPQARRHAVQIGRTVSPEEVGGAAIHIYSRPFEAVCATLPPFPSDPHYDAKAWEICRDRHGPGLVVFWNVTGPAE